MYGTIRCATHVSNFLRSYKSISPIKLAVTASGTRLYANKGNAGKQSGTKKSSDNIARDTTIRPSTPPHVIAGTCKPIMSPPECGKPNVMKEVPQPECPWDGEPKQRKYGKHLAIGILLTALSLFAFYKYGMDTTKKEVEKKQEKRRKEKIPVKFPATSKEIPSKIRYLLIGGGTASFSAFRSIKSLDPKAKVLVISNESFYPYMRPPLSKEMWFNEGPHSKPLVFRQWNGTERSLFYEPEDFYVDCKRLRDEPNGGVSVARGWTVKKIDVFGRKAYLEDDHVIEYEKCLIATGSSPKNLPVFKEASQDIQERVSLFRDIFDYEELEEILKGGVKKIAIIGGGFLGSELACALARRGQNQGYKITQIFRESGNMGRVLPEYLSFWTTHKVQKEGVEVIPNSEVEDVSLDTNAVVLHLNSGEKVSAEHVIVAVGVEPNTQLAEPSELETDDEFGGYLVNAELMARSNLWIAGDCTCFYDTKLGRRRVEHHDHAVVSGRLAGENMTGAVGVFAKATDKDTPKSVVSETDEGNRAASEAKAKPVTPATSSPSPPQDGEDYGKGVIFYLRDDIVVGIVLWNVFNRMSVARQVLRDERKYDDLNEVAKLFNIHEEQP
ncbi:Putative apoptosis-inducing factor 1, mitochondrial [Gryllus bimaculatus]|nr:Putative apoptosis-inducing factor 1, mitochondrial [Gryllus bimaculatus]